MAGLGPAVEGRVAVGDGGRVDKRLHTEETEPYIASIPTRILAHPLLL